MKCNRFKRCVTLTQELWNQLVTWSVSFIYNENSNSKTLTVIPDVNWGSSTQAQTYKSALNSVQHLVHVEEHVKNYRPQILVLSGLPSARPPLIDFANLICKQLSLMVCGHVVKNQLNQRTRASFNNRMYHWFRMHKIKAFYNVVDNSGFQGSLQFLITSLVILSNHD